MFKASRKCVYEALTDAKQFDKVMHIGGGRQGWGSTGQGANGHEQRSGWGVHDIWRPYHRKAARAFAERENCAGVARGGLECGDLLNCEV